MPAGCFIALIPLEMVSRSNESIKLLLGKFTISAKNYLRDGQSVAYLQLHFYNGRSYQHFCKAHAFFLAVFLWYPTYAYKVISINDEDTLTLRLAASLLRSV